VGLYAAIVGSIVGALWGSSAQLQTGPTNAASLLVLTILLAAGLIPGTPEYLAAAGLLALLVGVIRTLMGLVRLGRLVNFVSDSVIVGFTAGAGLLIFFNQLRNLFRLDIASAPRLDQTIPRLLAHISQTHIPSLIVGLGTVLVIVTLRRVNRKLPGPLIAIVIASLAVVLLGLDDQGVKLVGELPRGLPPLARLPLTDLDLVQRLSTGALAIAAIGLIEALSIARSISGQTGQQLDSNQEFVGQGLSNIACGFLSGYTCSGSFTRSVVNFEAGARSALSSVFSGLFVLLAILLLSPLATSIPLSSLAGVLILVSYGLIDFQEMRRIWGGVNGDRAIMIVTLLATLLLPLQFAVLSGILVSLAHYLLKTSTPRVRTVLPNGTFEHFHPGTSKCPQLNIVEILGDLYFGAVCHVEDYIRPQPGDAPAAGQRFLLLRLHSVENCDISGIHMLERVVRSYRETNGDVFLVKIQRPVLAAMRATGFSDYLGSDHFLSEDNAIEHLFYHTLDPAICIYECPMRAFRECQNLPKQLYPEVERFYTESPDCQVPSIQPRALWDALRGEQPPLVIDVREPREFGRGHIPQARLIPLPNLLSGAADLPAERAVTVVCRGSRRSTRAAHILLKKGHENVTVLQGGMLAWEAAGLLAAVDE
jgi:SulP family sulfate permease